MAEIPQADMPRPPAKEKAGLWIFSRNQEGEPVGFGQIRGLYTTNMALDEATSEFVAVRKDESWRRAVQPTVHGKWERGDGGIWGTVKRETGEEVYHHLMHYFRGMADAILRNYKFSEAADPSLVLGTPISSPEDPAVTWGVEMPFSQFLDMVHFHRDSGGRIELTRKSVENVIFLNPKDKESKTRIFNPPSEVAMFRDDHATFLRGMDMFEKGLLAPNREAYESLLASK